MGTGCDCSGMLMRTMKTMTAEMTAGVAGPITVSRGTRGNPRAGRVRAALPSTERMYRALVERDVALDGHFVVGVKTTGIFCRCVCTARKPLKKNVEFFATGREAMHAGYRACLRCRPMDDPAAERAPAWLEKLKRLADDEPGRRVRDRDLREMKLDPSSVRRMFKAKYGMTFQAYARARRMGLALAAVRRGSRMEEAKSRGGYASDSGFREAFERLFGSAADGKGARGASVLAARWIETPLGAMLALADDAGLRLLDFVDRRGLERQIGRIRVKLSCMIVPGEHAHLDAVEKWLERYFKGQCVIGSNGAHASALGVPLSPGGGETLFQKRVWEQLRSIPLGQTRSYAEQARAIGNPAAVRAVARANGENFIGIVTPCHRVIGSDGSMTGYGGGVWRKQWLLEHEARMACAAASR